MTMSAAENFDIGKVSMRLATELDHSTIQELFKAGLVDGLVPANDTGADIENLQEAYFSDEGQSGLWVATYTDDKEGDKVIGMIGVQKTSESAAEVRRLRVREGYRRHGVGTRLMEQALVFCKRHGYLKITLDVRIERGPAIGLFEKFGFQLARSREADGRKTLEFYLDLYTAE